MKLRFVNHYKQVLGLMNRWLHKKNIIKIKQATETINCEHDYVGITLTFPWTFFFFFFKKYEQWEYSAEPKRANIIIINPLSGSFLLYHLHQLSARSASRLRCVCARALSARVREKWAKAPPHSKKSERKKGKANWYTPLNSGRRKRIGVFMNRISKQQNNKAHREPSVFPRKNRQQATFPSAGDCPVAFRIKFLCHLKVDHYLNPR